MGVELAFCTRVKYGVLLSAGDEGSLLSSWEVAALAECTVLSHLRDLLNSNVSQKPGLQCCLIPHSKPACWIDLERLGGFSGGDLWDSSYCVFVFPRTCDQNPPFHFFFSWHTWRMCIDRFKYNILQFRPVGCAIHFFCPSKNGKEL